MESVPIEIPEHIADQIDERVSKSSFDDRSSYVTYILEEVIYRIDQEDSLDLDNIDQEKVENRLEALGYVE
jgi:Arc/MetJ-type ribon-helix-helix transcriptional regulator